MVDVIRERPTEPGRVAAPELELEPVGRRHVAVPHRGERSHRADVRRVDDVGGDDPPLFLQEDHRRDCDNTAVADHLEVAPRDLTAVVFGGDQLPGAGPLAQAQHVPRASVELRPSLLFGCSR